MTPQKRREARAKQEAMQKARKDQRLGLAKQNQKNQKKDKKDLYFLKNVI